MKLSDLLKMSASSLFKRKLRTVLPMSAAGAEYRLENLETRLRYLIETEEAKQTELSSEQLRWAVEEAGACSRSLALLQCELLAKGLL